MRLAIIGSRSFDNSKLLNETLEPYKDRIKLVVSGGAKGADQLGEYWARLFKIETLIFLPDWEKHGKKAGFIRNKQIIENCDMCIAFWDNWSKGTRHSISLCEKLNKPYRIIEFKNK